MHSKRMMPAVPQRWLTRQFYWALACGLLFSCVGLGPQAAWAQKNTEQTTEAVVAAIGYEPILLTEALAYQRAFGLSGSLRLTVEQMVDERLLAQEARRYGIEAAHPSSSPPADDKESQRFKHDRALAAQFLKFRFGEFVPVTREDVAGYLVAHPDTPGRDAEEKNRIARERLLPTLRSRREAAFKTELRVRAEVRFMVDDASIDSVS